MIAENARDVPAWSSRSASPTLSIAKVGRLRSFNPLSRRAGLIAPPLCPPRRAEVEHCHWDEAVRCLSVDPVSVVWLCGLDG